MRIDVRQHVHRTAEHYGLPRNLVAAVVQVESGGDSDAYRVEPHYRWLWDVERNKPFSPDNALLQPDDFPTLGYVSPATEFWGQKTSWGLMQVMGAVAREQGFNRPYMTTLCSDPREGLAAGCRHLVTLHRRYGHKYGWEGVVAAYNAGSVRRKGEQYVNQGYVDKIRELGGLPA